MTIDRDGHLLRQAELAERWRITARTLERWRSEGYGPAWLTIGGSIRYRLGDVLDFERRNHSGAR